MFYDHRKMREYGTICYACYDVAICGFDDDKNSKTITSIKSIKMWKVSKK